MDFKHNFKKDDIFNIFDPPPKMTNVIFFFNEGFPYQGYPGSHGPTIKGLRGRTAKLGWVNTYDVYQSS